MPLSIEGRPERSVALAVCRGAAEAGMDHVDTAAVYGLDGDDAHHGEALVAEALRSFPDVRIATKGGVYRRGEHWIHDGRPETLRRSCERSLDALHGRAIDLFYLHAVDARVPIEESVGALEDLRREQCIGAVGISNVDAPKLRRALSVATFAAVQNEMSPYVAPCPEVLALCRAHGLRFVGYAPLGGYRAGRIAHEPLLRAVATEGLIDAEERRAEATPHEVVLAWLLGRYETHLVAGASRGENVRSSARAAGLRLRPAQVRRMDAVFPRS